MGNQCETKQMKMKEVPRKNVFLIGTSAKLYFLREAIKTSLQSFKTGLDKCRGLHSAPTEYHSGFGTLCFLLQ